MNHKLSYKIRGMILLLLLTVGFSISVPGFVMAESESTPVEVASTFQGCDSPAPLSRTERLAVIAKVVLETENEVSAVMNQQDGKGAASLTTNVALRNRLATFAAGSFSDSIKFVSMDRSCWARFYGAQTKLAEDDEIGAVAEAKEWKDCLTAMFPERVALAKPYFSCFLVDETTKSDSKSESKSVKKSEKKSGPAPAGVPATSPLKPVDSSP